MQGLADGYFVIPYTIGDYLADDIQTPRIDTNHEEFAKAEKSITEKLEKLKNIKGNTPVDHFHKDLGKIMWDKVGMSRNEKELKEAIEEIKVLRKKFWEDLKIPGELNEFNPEIEKAMRVADFLEMGELMARDALERNESCGGHFREESKTDEGEAKRDDEKGSYVSAWEFKGDDIEPEMHKEDLEFEFVTPTQRSYK